MKAIISISKNGNQLALKLASIMPEVHCYTLSKWQDDQFLAINGKLSDYCEVLFKKYDALIFIMASGIVVRSIAPWLKDKTTDPAIIVMDEKGMNVISLLSGHLGGANELCLQISETLNVHPVITTASDVNHLPSVDMMAKSMNLVIDNMEDAKLITAMIVNGEKVGLVDEDGYFRPDYLPSVEGEMKGKIIVSDKILQKESIPFAQLIPKNIVLGIGCKKDTDPKALIAFIRDSLNELKLDERSVQSIASIELKKDEKAIHATADYLKCEMRFYSKEKLKEVDHLFDGSAFVKSTVGVASVSSASAYLVGNKEGEFLLVKRINMGMTLSVFKKEKI